MLVTQLRIKEIHQTVNTAVINSRKTEILNEEGHIIKVQLNNNFKIKIHREVVTGECVVIGKERF